MISDYTKPLNNKYLPRLYWDIHVTGAEKERGPTGNRTQGLSFSVRALYH